MKNNEFAVVIENLTDYLEADDIENDKAPVRACHRYLRPLPLIQDLSAIAFLQA